MTEKEIDYVAQEITAVVLGADAATPKNQIAGDVARLLATTIAKAVEEATAK